eukprot:gene8700-11067_t
MTNHDLTSLSQTIDTAFDDRDSVNTGTRGAVRDAVETALNLLDSGKVRVAERGADGNWTVNQWLKKAVLLSFRLKDNEIMRAGDLGFFDKVKTKFSHLSEAEMKATGVRVVPPAVARRGSFVAKGAILMPSYVNIGAYVDENTM